MRGAHLLAQLSFSEPAPRDPISSRIIAIPELCDGFALSEENIEKKETTAMNGILAPFLSIPTNPRGHSFLFYLFPFFFFITSIRQYPSYLIRLRHGSHGCRRQQESLPLKRRRSLFSFLVLEAHNFEAHSFDPHRPFSLLLPPVSLIPFVLLTPTFTP